MVSERSTLVRRRMLAMLATGVSASIAGCDATDSDDLGGANSEDDQVEEPDETPAGLGEDVDLERLLDNTERALREGPFEITGWLAQSSDSGQESAEVRGRALSALGDVEADTARYERGENHDGELTEVSEEADSVTERYFDDGVVLERRQWGDGEPEYGRQEGDYSDFVRPLERALLQYHEVGTEIEFAEPEWNDDHGAYEIEGVEFDDSAVEIVSCKLFANADGVIEHVSAELHEEGNGSIQTEVDGAFEAVSVEEPNWTDEADGRLPLWTFDVGERPRSVIEDETIYTTSVGGVDAIYREDGTESWFFSASESHGGSDLTDELLITADMGGVVYALSRSDGSVQWETELDAARIAPVVADGEVYVLGMGSVYRLDPDDGTELWGADVGDQTMGIEFGEEMYIGSIQGEVYAVDRDDGEISWTFESPTRNWVTPSALRDGSLYLESYEGGLYAIETQSGTEQWHFDGSTSNSRLVLDEDRLYVSGEEGQLFALDAADGSESWDYTVDESTTLTPTPAGSTVYVGGYDGNVYAVSADDGSLEWTFETGGRVEGVTVADDALYVGSRDNHLYSIERSDGSERWNVETNYWVRTPPTVIEQYLYATDAGRGGGVVYAFDREALNESA